MAVLRIGHRGAMGYEPENTLRSFRKALELRCDMIEMDVRVCATGEAVLFHDDTLDRTTEGKGPMEEKSWESLRTLNAGKGEGIPLLREALDLIAGKAVVNVELKGRGTAKPASDIIAAFRRKGGFSARDVLVSSFHREELDTFRRYDRETPIGILFEKIPADIPGLVRRIGAYSLHPYHRVASPELISSAHGSGLKVFVWTVNDPDDIAALKKLGVDGIFSNFPDRV